jgi:hypothetical protein
MHDSHFTEHFKKRVGGNLSRLQLLRRLEMLRANGRMLRGGHWVPPGNDGTLVRKVVGLKVAKTVSPLRLNDGISAS